MMHVPMVQPSGTDVVVVVVVCGTKFFPWNRKFHPPDDGEVSSWLVELTSKEILKLLATAPSYMSVAARLSS